MKRDKDTQINENHSGEPDAARLQRVEEILDRGIVAKLLPSRKVVAEMLAAHKPARIYIGADPTGSALHLSHAKNYMLLEELRQLGHHVIVLFGDFTARIGDPTDRASARTQLNEDTIKENVKKWLNQIRPIINFEDATNPAYIEFNGKWLAQLTLTDVISLASTMTVQRMLERDMFEKRMENEEPIFLHEFLYPLMQGYDSVAMNIDIELCGTDQEFNALVGRTLCSRLQDREKGIIEVNLLENPRTGELMSKSAGRGVFLDGSPTDLYGQIMALPDEMIRPCFINVTRVPLTEIDQILAGHPRTAKATLARKLVETFHGADAAQKAEEEFTNTFSKGGVPEEMPTVRGEKGKKLADILVEEKIIFSKSDWRRLVEEGAVKNIETSEAIEDTNTVLEQTIVLKIGKHRFVRIEIS